MVTEDGSVIAKSGNLTGGEPFAYLVTLCPLSCGRVLLFASLFFFRSHRAFSQFAWLWLDPRLCDLSIREREHLRGPISFSRQCEMRAFAMADSFAFVSPWFSFTRSSSGVVTCLGDSSVHRVVLCIVSLMPVSAPVSIGSGVGKYAKNANRWKEKDVLKVQKERDKLFKVRPLLRFAFGNLTAVHHHRS